MVFREVESTAIRTRFRLTVILLSCSFLCLCRRMSSAYATICWRGYSQRCQCHLKLRLTKEFIWITGILHCILGFGTAIVYFVQGYYATAIVFLIFALFYTLCFFSWRKRIPFAVQILRFTM